MAVPKKKTSKSKRNMRRSHDSLSKINVVIDKNTGEYRLPHRIDATNGFYNGKHVVIEKAENTQED
jgi:large subunit ribosomal protein L32